MVVTKIQGMADVNRLVSAIPFYKKRLYTINIPLRNNSKILSNFGHMSISPNQCSYFLVNFDF
ncbi:hypothetical protein BN1326_190001 [Staphylococcus argenteus]|uniref:Uncharacterized protein n=1 Tax=Staphylococcus argenteus TaxID=985002 RepID=A0A7U7JS59_9STAP|nr:hypothetical protein BN1326_190001 [Staphylococcus argenteus]CRI19657.1 hypothetical protein BN1326_190001 [Staphylococcus argenteus]